MNVGDDAWVVYTGSECGSGISITKVQLIKRNTASWTVYYPGNGHIRAHFDKTHDTHLFGSTQEAEDWLLDRLLSRVEAAEEVVKQRKATLEAWKTKLGESK